MSELANRRPLKSRQTGWAGALARLLLRTPLTPNAVSLAGIGFAAGVERLVALRETLQVIPEENDAVLVAVVPMGEEAEATAWAIADELRRAHIATDIAYKGNGKKRFERANKVGATHAVVLGGDELASGTVTLKDLKTGTQETFPRSQLMKKLES